ncbi:hypothetical protein KSS87_003780 [Heliosperma pusillum]|nr:hypothetical protein KSS87_003780 [Heliosperma pusillum]
MNGHTDSITNGEEPEISESRLGYAKVEKEGHVHIDSAQKEGTIVQRNGYDVVTVSSVPDSTSGYEGMSGISSNEFHLFDESSCSVTFIASDRCHSEQNTVNINLVEDVNRVLNKQELHDLHCPTCNFYFTRRALPRKAIAPDYEHVILPAGEVRVPMLDNEEPLLGDQREDSRVEVIKAVVYGGLLESIASLSIIVSAAGGDATTLNIVALGLANVFGGLLVLANSLMTLKELTGQQYEDQLGQPGHFLMHAVIAVISYLVFGLMSPLIYGFSFYKSDNKYLKLATLAASSLMFITALSTGKAYVQRPPKAYLKTVFYYISLTVAVSGIAYVAGNLISILLKNLSVFESETSNSMPALEARLLNGPWSSY